MSEVSMNIEYEKSSAFDKNVSMKKTAEFLVPDAELAFSWCRMNLRIIGLWPDQTCNGTLITKYRSLICGLLVSIFTVVPQASAPIVYNIVLGDLIELINVVTGNVAGVFKIIVIWYNSEALAWCLTFISNDWIRKVSKEDRETMIENAKFARKISIGVIIAIQSLVMSYVMLQAGSLFTLNFEAQNTTEFGKRLFYASYFPFDITKRYNFAFAWSCQCIGLILVAFAYGGTDGFVAILVIHLCGQIAILRNSLINMIDDNAPMSVDIFRAKLRLIVKRHQTLIRFGTVIKDTVSWLLLVLIIACTVQLGLQLFRLLTAVTDRKPGQFPFLQIIALLLFLKATLVHLFLYCYVGNMLIEESLALEMTSYSCRWYNLSGKCANDIKLVMRRANVPLQIWAGKFAPFSLELFSNVLKTSMSYFSVLLTMKEQSTE